MKPKKKSTTTVEIVSSERKKNPPRTAFKPGNEHRFKPGHDAMNTNGSGPHKMHLVSRALKVQLCNRAPANVSKALGISSHSSWGQALAASLLRRAVSGDLQAAQLVVESTEGKRSRLEFVDESVAEQMQRLEICFVESDGNGHPKRLPQTINGSLSPESLPPPE